MDRKNQKPIKATPSRKLAAALATQPHGRLVANALKLSVEFAELQTRFEHMRKIVWMAAHQNGGVLEIDEDIYRATMKAPPADIVTKLTHDKKAKKVLIEECDFEGNPISRIIRI